MDRYYLALPIHYRRLNANGWVYDESGVWNYYDTIVHPMLKNRMRMKMESAHCAIKLQEV